MFNEFAENVNVDMIADKNIFSDESPLERLVDTLLSDLVDAFLEAEKAEEDTVSGYDESSRDLGAPTCSAGTFYNSTTKKCEDCSAGTYRYHCTYQMLYNY